jgi:hypothetical protein
MAETRTEWVENSPPTSIPNAQGAREGGTHPCSDRWSVPTWLHSDLADHIAWHSVTQWECMVEGRTPQRMS